MSENERKFREMWSWIAEETRRQKRHVKKFEYFYAFDISKGERPYCGCYACEEGRQRTRDNGRDGGMGCSYCPIDWGKCDCTREGALYNEWEHARSYEEAAKFAEKIAQMEWRNADE